MNAAKTKIVSPIAHCELYVTRWNNVEQKVADHLGEIDYVKECEILKGPYFHNRKTVSLIAVQIQRSRVKDFIDYLNGQGYILDWKLDV